MKRIILAIIFTAGFARAINSQPIDSIPPEQFGITHLTEYLGLLPSDIGFRPDYTEPDSFRLELVVNLMKQPLGMIDYIQELSASYVSRQPEIIAGILFQDIKRENQRSRSRAYQAGAEDLEQRYILHYNDAMFNQMLSRVANYIDIIFPRSVDKSLALLSPDQRKFLRHEFRELLVIGEEEEFLSVEAIDSLDKVEEGYCEEFVSFGANYDKDPIISAGVDFLRELMAEVRGIKRRLDRKEITVETIFEGLGYVPDNADLNTYLGRQDGWVIGGTGNDYYTGHYSLIFDFGGDDIYDLSADADNPQSTIIIDLSGNDSYRGSSDFVYGAGFFSVGILLDFEGDDRYDGGSFSLGSGYFGFGLLYDAQGDDHYSGDTHVQGAGTFGLGLLIDEDGRDIYNAALYSQGFGSVEGLGLIYDQKGSDSYYAGGKYKDILRYADHFLSLSQGFGYGFRPFMSGGIGLIIDKEGNDNYYADIFAQAASYWWSLGMIYNSLGNDNYQCFQYGQGAATHMTLGALIDDYGNDVYFGKGLMQGCGHDYSCGLILDRHGDDLYIAFDLSQGAGSANGVGLLIDNEGDDRYFIKNPANTQGYGNPRRDFGSIGLFIDLSGSDLYNGNGRDNYYWRTNSKWGGGMDIELLPPDSTEKSQK